MGIPRWELFSGRPSNATLRAWLGLRDVLVGFVPPLFGLRCFIAVAEGGCCSISDDLSCSCY